MKRHYKYAGIDYHYVDKRSPEKLKDYLYYEFDTIRTAPVLDDWALGKGGLFAATFAVVALDGDKMVGWWATTQSYNGGPHWSNGTWVHKDYRNKGIAKRLWSLGIRASKTKTISVTAVSRKGLTLVLGMKRRFPNVTFRIHSELAAKTDLKGRRAA